jgi:glycosyltransferase involved in cell wall biosynthesis
MFLVGSVAAPAVRPRLGISMRRSVVLVLCDHYLPGYKAGGPITSLANMVSRLGQEFEFRIVTRNQDLGESTPYDDIVPNTWSRLQGADVCHLDAGATGKQYFRSVLTHGKYDVLYLNSLFSNAFSVRPILMHSAGRLPKRPIVLAPRGELCAGAVRLKWWKKLPFLRVAHALGCYRDILWQASSEQESAEIRRWFGSGAWVCVAPNLAAHKFDVADHQAPAPKPAGQIKLLFLSRVAAKKNLEAAISMLRHLRGRVAMDVVGPIEDRGYWRRCEDAIRTLPGNVQVSYRGIARPAEVPRLMKEHDLFLLPTLGENFGHVILEALSAWCPVLISDQTPWRRLASSGAGWDIPLSRPDLFTAAIQECVDMDAPRFAALRRSARNFALGYHRRNEEIIEQNRELFLRAQGRRTPALLNREVPRRKIA